MIDSKSFKPFNGKCVSLLTYLDLSVQHEISKSAESISNHFDISVKTIDTSGTPKHYTFAMNEMEVSFSKQTGNVFAIILRDTSVNKKIELSGISGTLVYAKGQDTLGKNSEMDSKTSIENIVYLKINNNEFKPAFDISDIYLELTGQTPESLIEEDESSGRAWWDTL